MQQVIRNRAPPPNAASCPPRLRAIAQRAETIGMSLSALTSEAGCEVAVSTVNRWMAGGSGPSLRKFERACGALEKELERREIVLRQTLG
jgi:hypothetical protein